MANINAIIPVTEGDPGVTTIKQIFDASANESYVLWYPEEETCDSMTLDGGALVSSIDGYKCARLNSDIPAVGSGISLESILADEQETVICTAVNVTGDTTIKVKRIGGVGYNSWENFS